ncbi:MAG: acyl-CoA desaturase [Cyanobacteria bacterium J06634_6]
MNTAHKMVRVQAGETANPCKGRVIWNPIKSVWILSMYAGAIVGGCLTFSWSAFWLFTLTSIFTLCAGHSVGMHRRLIHNSFCCPKWVEYMLVYFGTLIGLAGPFSIIYMHELRDWSQRQPDCHDYFASRQPLLKDWFWLLNCDIRLAQPPTIRYEAKIANDRFYWLLEKTRYLHQIPWAVLFYLVFGWGGVFWGIFMRVSVCTTGHWLMGYCAHRWGEQNWKVAGAGVQGYNVPWCGLITMGECWHNNHHAFPDSAKLGLQSHQSDPGWWFICALQKLGLAWDVQKAHAALAGENLVRVPVYRGRDRARLINGAQLFRSANSVRRKYCPFRQRL